MYRNKDRNGYINTVTVVLFRVAQLWVTYYLFFYFLSVVYCAYMIFIQFFSCKKKMLSKKAK